MTHISNANIIAMANQSRNEALVTLDRMIKKAQKAENPQEVFDKAVDIMQTAWEARSCGFMAALSPTYRWRVTSGPDHQGDERANAVLLIAGHPELIERVQAVVNEYRASTG